MSKEDLLVKLTSKDHFVVCRALKQLAKIERLDEDVLREVMKLTSSDVEAIEKNALNTLGAAGLQALPLRGDLLQQLCRRIRDGKGCTYDCCGFTAYYAPVEVYLETLLTISDQSGIATELENLAPVVDAATLDEVRFLLTQFED